MRMIHNPELVFEICFESSDGTCRWDTVRSNKATVLLLLALRQCEQGLWNGGCGGGWVRSCELPSLFGRL